MHFVGFELLQMQALSLAHCIHGNRYIAGCPTPCFANAVQDMFQRPEAAHICRAVKCACLLQAKRKLVDVSQQRDQLQGSIEELQQKYNQKCQ